MLDGSACFKGELPELDRQIPIHTFGGFLGEAEEYKTRAAEAFIRS